MSEPRTCKICGNPFVPNKHHPYQENCSSRKCQNERRKRYMARYNKVWQKRHKDYWREYWKKKSKKSKNHC